MKVIFLIIIGLSSLSFSEFSRENGIIYDSNTKLEWQDDYSDNNGKIKATTWQNAINYCESLKLDNGGWRLPNLRELESLVDDTKINPSINGIFKFIKSNYYWSSTHIFSRYDAWSVGFYYGDINFDGFNDIDTFVRCVRDAKN